MRRLTGIRLGLGADRLWSRLVLTLFPLSSSRPTANHPRAIPVHHVAGERENQGTKDAADTDETLVSRPQIFGWTGCRGDGSRGRDALASGCQSEGGRLRLVIDKQVHLCQAGALSEVRGDARLRHEGNVPVTEMPFQAPRRQYRLRKRRFAVRCTRGPTHIHRRC